MSTSSTEGLKFALFSMGASPEIPAADRIYDFLIGSWALDVTDRLDDGTIRKAAGECHAAWVLEGRAVQDVWISPPIGARSASTPRLGNRFGSTLRVYDPALRAWRVTWTNPVSGIQTALVGRRVGDDVVQEGQDPRGNSMRWCFRKITATSAHWTGELSLDGGRTWTLETEFQLNRIGGRPA